MGGSWSTFRRKGCAGLATCTRPPVEPLPPCGGQRSPVPGDLWPLAARNPLKGFPVAGGLFVRRALQRNTKLRRAPGALYARLPLRALRAEEVAEREPAAIPARPKPSHRAPGHAHFRERALGMRSARASIKYMAAVLPTPASMPEWEQRMLSMPSRHLKPKRGPRSSRTRAPPPRINACSTTARSNTQVRQEAHLGTPL